MSQPEGIPFSKVAEDVVLIAVMGVTGSGKSNFVKLVTESEEVVVGKALTSCTKKPSLHRFNHAGTEVILIDTPGFDDTFLSDVDVLRDIATCLQITYQADMKLTGIIYMHRIIDIRMAHGGMRNLAMFRKLCGSDSMENVILSTSFWDKVTEQEGLEREEELRTNPDFWAEMIEEGAQIARFENARESGLALVETLVRKGRISLQIQKEMCDEGIPLAQTQAGEHVNGELAEMTRKHTEEMAKIQQELQDALKAADQKLERTLKRELTKGEKKYQRLYEQQEALKADRRNEMRIVEQEFDRLHRRIKAGNKEEDDAFLKKKLAVARHRDRRNHDQQAQRQQKPGGRNEKKMDKFLKVGSAVAKTTLSVAVCFVNPLHVVSALGSFVRLVNLICSGESSAVSSGFGTPDESYDQEDWVDYDA